MDQRQLLSNGRSNLWFLGNKKNYFNLNELKACKTIYLGKIHQFRLKLSDYERVCASACLRGWVRVRFICAHTCNDIRLMVFSRINKYGIQATNTYAPAHTAQSHQHSKQFNRKCNFKKISLDSTINANKQFINLIFVLPKW